MFKHYKTTIYNYSTNGLNANLACGANHIETLQNYMESNEEFDIGFAFDGDADRMQVVLKGGQILSGEEVIYFLSKYYKNQKIVVSKMTNFGLYDLLSKEGIKCVTCGIGEKNVMNTLLENNLHLGCENNGHYTLLDKTPTSDGILSAIKILSIFATRGNLNCKYKPYYQITKNIKVKDKNFVMKSSLLRNCLDVCESLISDMGRILVRASGTENLIRILVEGKNKKMVDEIMEEISKTIKKLI